MVGPWSTSPPSAFPAKKPYPARTILRIGEAMKYTLRYRIARRILRSISVLTLALECLIGLPGPAVGAWTVGTPIVTYWNRGTALTEAIAQQAVDGGYNLVWVNDPSELPIAARHGLRALANDTHLSKIDYGFKQSPTTYAYFLEDEPTVSQFDYLAGLVGFVRNLDPDALAFINLYPNGGSAEMYGAPSYSAYLDQFINTVHPHVLAYDKYQFLNGRDDGSYLENLGVISQKAKQAGVPFINSVQACAWDTYYYRVPTQNELRLLVYSTAAYGAQGISYFNYFTQTPNTGGLQPNPDGTPTAVYTALTPLNKEFKNIAAQYQSLKLIGNYLKGYSTTTEWSWREWKYVPKYNGPPGTATLPSDSPFSISSVSNDMEYSDGAPLKGVLFGFFDTDGTALADATIALIQNLDCTTTKTFTINGPGGNLSVFNATTGVWMPDGPELRRRSYRSRRRNPRGTHLRRSRTLVAYYAGHRRGGSAVGLWLPETNIGFAMRSPWISDGHDNGEQPVNHYMPSTLKSGLSNMKSLNSRSALRRAPLAKPAPPLRGFTLVELLVVITIIGILIALLLPAVQAAREAARRMQCTNNLKQWALGALNHESAQGSLPTSGVSGWHVGDPDLGFGLKQVGGWMYNTLPYIEQQTFHDQGMGQPSFQKKAIWTKAVAVPLAALFCPSRRAPTAGGLGLYATGTVYWQNISRPTAIVHNDYAANTGGCTWQDFLDWSQNIPGSKPGNGVVVRNTLVKMADIKDGTSNTYLFGEKYLTPRRLWPTAWTAETTTAPTAASILTSNVGPVMSIPSTPQAPPAWRMYRSRIRRGESTALYSAVRIRAASTWPSVTAPCSRSATASTPASTNTSEIAKTAMLSMAASCKHAFDP